MLKNHFIFILKKVNFGFNIFYFLFGFFFFYFIVSIHSWKTSTGSDKWLMTISKLALHIRHSTAAVIFFRSILHSTILGWLQIGQSKIVATLSLGFLYTIFLVFLRPIFFSQKCLFVCLFFLIPFQFASYLR